MQPGLAGLDPVDRDLGIDQQLGHPLQLVDLLLTLGPRQVSIQIIASPRIGSLDLQAHIVEPLDQPLELLPSELAVL